MKPRQLAALGLLALMLAAGCGYTIRPPYDPTIRTVYVPIFRSYTFRRGDNLKLTRAVIQEMELRTPYRMVGSPEEADTILSGVIELEDKNLMVASPENLPRHLLAGVTVRVTWEDVRPGANRDEPPPELVIPETISFYPELGETASLAYEKNIDRIAQAIVGKMESPW